MHVSVGWQKRCGGEKQEKRRRTRQVSLNMWEAKKLHALEQIRLKKMSMSHKSTGQESIQLRKAYHRHRNLTDTWQTMLANFRPFTNYFVCLRRGKYSHFPSFCCFLPLFPCCLEQHLTMTLTMLHHFSQSYTFATNL